MTFQRLLAFVIALVLLSRLWPVVAPWVWPSLKPKVERLKRRADIATAVAMMTLTGSAFARGEPAAGALIGLLSLPALAAGLRAIKD